MWNCLTVSDLCPHYNFPHLPLPHSHSLSYTSDSVLQGALPSGHMSCPLPVIAGLCFRGLGSVAGPGLKQLSHPHQLQIISLLALLPQQHTFIQEQVHGGFLRHSSCLQGFASYKMGFSACIPVKGPMPGTIPVPSCEHSIEAPR